MCLSNRSALNFMHSTDNPEDVILRTMISVDSTQTVAPDVATPIEQPTDPELLQTVEEVVKAILDFMEIR